MNINDPMVIGKNALTGLGPIHERIRERREEADKVALSLMRKHFTVNSDESFDQFVKWAKAFYQEYHYVTFAKPRIGKDRTVLQNDFSFEAYVRIGEQLYGGDTQHARFECKLNIGCPILCADDPEFKETFKQVIAIHPYDIQLKMMKLLPVTSLMTRKQFRTYMQGVDYTYSSKGVHFGDLFDEKVA